MGKIKKKIFKGDMGIWIIILLLSIYSMLAVYSASSQLAYREAGGNTTFYLIRQAVMLMIGAATILVVHNIPYKYFSRASVFLWYLAIGLLVFTLFFGINVNEARRWIMLPGGITFQTSDFAKVALIMYIARNLAIKEEEVNTWKGCFKKLYFPILLTVGLILPANLSTAILLFGTTMLLIFFSNLKFKYFAAMIGASLVLGILFFGAVKTFKHVGRFETWNNRIENFTNKTDKEENIQEKHSKIAIAKGGLFGLGPGKSNQRNILPHPYSDYIFAIIIEEYGLIFGAIPLIVLYLYLFMRVRRIVKNTNRKFGAYIVSGLAALIVLQAFSNMAVTTNVIPVTGQPLPMVSYGGTSIIFMGMALGIILSVSREVEEMKDAKKSQGMEDDIPNAEIENADSEVIEPDEKVLEESLNLVINTKENEES
jgi:cell division protein FtsW